MSIVSLTALEDILKLYSIGFQNNEIKSWSYSSKKEWHNKCQLRIQQNIWNHLVVVSCWIEGWPVHERQKSFENKIREGKLLGDHGKKLIVIPLFNILLKLWDHESVVVTRNTHNPHLRSHTWFLANTESRFTVIRKTSAVLITTSSYCSTDPARSQLTTSCTV